jgi:hypothetical protein
MAAATAAVAACVASTYDEGCAGAVWEGGAACLGAAGFDEALGASGRAMRLSVGFFAGFCWVCCAGGWGGAVAAAVDGLDSTGGGGALEGVAFAGTGVPDISTGLLLA